MMSVVLPTLDDLDAITAMYPHKSQNFAIVRAQIEQRAQLVRFWGINPGENVLEIGCGQGDCTVVLATAVGDGGSVTAVDPASLDYGTSPVSVHACTPESMQKRTDPQRPKQAHRTLSDRPKRTSVRHPSGTA